MTLLAFVLTEFSNSVEIMEIYSHLTHFWQKFRESNGFTKEITKWLI